MHAHSSFLTLIVQVQNTFFFYDDLDRADDVLLDTPGRCARARWLCIIDQFGVNKYLTRAMPISVGPLGEPILAEAALEDWHDRRASTH